MSLAPPAADRALDRGESHAPGRGGCAGGADRAGRRSGRRAWLVAVLAAVAGHATLLALCSSVSMAPAAGGHSSSPHGATVVARATTMTFNAVPVAARAPASHLTVDGPAPGQPIATPQPAPSRIAARRGDAPEPAPTAPAPAPGGAARPAVPPPRHAGAPPVPADPLATRPHAASPQANPTAAAAPPAPSPPLPTYRTRPPPSLSLDYEVLRGGTRALARLEWRIEDEASQAQPAQGTTPALQHAQTSQALQTSQGTAGEPPTRRYQLALRGVPAPPEENAAAPSARADAPVAPHWTSHGAFDADGIAPQRFAVSRRGRERHAANFRRDIGEVSFSGPATTWPLAAGAQDRLSWMVQLAAVLEADPALAQTPAAQVSMMVVGAHGDAAVWHFVAQGSEILPGPGGRPVVARLFRREAQHPHDTDVSVWVARELHHLPLRVRLARPLGGESTELRLHTLQAP